MLSITSKDSWLTEEDEIHLPNMRRTKTQKAAPEKGAGRLTGDGLVIVDGSLKPIAFNRGAEAILCDINGGPGQSEGWGTLPPDLLNLLKSQSQLDEAVMYLNARGHAYSCRAFVVKPRSNVITEPMLALYLTQETSVVNAVLQVGTEYHLTDREQEALIGVAMGLSSKELATRMNISPNTVKAFLRLIMIKMGSTTRAGIVGKLIDLTGRSSAQSTGR
jgi:DNA-binding CsgD family transcriptional regulator